MNEIAASSWPTKVAAVPIPADTLPARHRLEGIDLLRGVAMLLMAIDHVREFLSSAQYDPTDLSQTTPGIFLSRWVTHFCAPVFVFLAGAGACLAARQKGKRHAARFLLVRGLLLVLLELTVVRFAWYFNMNYGDSVGQVIWVIGWSMVALSAVMFLPTPAVALLGVLLIAGHNRFDGVSPESLGVPAWLWSFLHAGGALPLPGLHIHVAYAFLPWFGVMAAGYGFGALLQLSPHRRRLVLWGLGLALSLAFVALRTTNLYGDPHPWSVQPTTLYTVFSFVNCNKYPPSLLFVLMTLGPAILVIPFIEHPRSRLGQALVLFGRVPLFFYVAHLFVIHALAIALTKLTHGTTPDWLFSFPPGHAAPGYGYGLPALYLIWLGVILLLYPACRKYAAVRRNRPWLSYL